MESNSSIAAALRDLEEVAATFERSLFTWFGDRTVHAETLQRLVDAINAARSIGADEYQVRRSVAEAFKTNAPPPSYEDPNLF